MTLSGAYGRDYKSKKDIQADFDAGKDFQVRDFLGGSGYTNKTDLLSMGVKSVTVRYKQDRSVTVITVK